MHVTHINESGMFAESGWYRGVNFVPCRTKFLFFMEEMVNERKVAKYQGTGSFKNC